MDTTPVIQLIERVIDSTELTEAQETALNKVISMLNNI